MSENLKSFLKLASQDESLKARAAEFAKMEKEDLVKTCIALAAERGITLTEADFESGSSADSGELSDDELDAVSGGCNKNEIGCICVAGGGGEFSYEDTNKKYVCACVAYGQGGSEPEPFSCLCLVGGDGQENRSYDAN